MWTVSHRVSGSGYSYSLPTRMQQMQSWQAVFSQPVSAVIGGGVELLVRVAQPFVTKTSLTSYDAVGCAGFSALRIFPCPGFPTWQVWQRLVR